LVKKGKGLFVEEYTENNLMSYRKSIDRLDEILIHTLAERFQKTNEIGFLKARKNLPSFDKVREEDQMIKFKKLAKENDLDPKMITNFFKLIISEVKKNHEKIKKNIKQT
tara:strand:+ start:953 stop:1282 length:330 start_codon:yes stop_codon:yes gene_type:complete